MAEPTTADLFRRAWLSTTGDERIDRLSRMSLAAAASDVPELADVLDELQAEGTP